METLARFLYGYFDSILNELCPLIDDPRVRVKS